MIKRLLFLIVSLSLALMFSSCVSTKGGSVQQTLDQQEQHASSGDHQKAIEGYNEALLNHPDESSVIQSYTRTLERIKTSADQAYKEKKYASAIQTYTVLSKNYNHFKLFEKSLSFDSKYISLMLRKSRIARSKTLAQSAFKSSEYMEAIEAYSVSLQYYPNDQSLINSFVAIVTEIHQIGENALKSGHYVTAGNVYLALLRKYSLLEISDGTLPFSKKSVEGGLKQCQNILKRKGLEQYRKGNLEAAISIWKDILKFDPENVEIKKAIENAESQLKKIKKESDNQKKPTY